MSDFFDKMEDTMNVVETENGAGAYSTTKNACLDAFGSLGAMMHSSTDMIIGTFEKAFNEDSALATKMLFYMRDIRGGQGQRRVFRTILSWLANNHPEVVRANFHNILYYGRGDDYLCLLDTDLVRDACLHLKFIIEEDVNLMRAGREVSLLAKWMPSENASSKNTKRYAKIIRDTFMWTPKQYRCTLSNLRKYIDVVERKMSANQWRSISYQKTPSKASINYSRAFYRHDEEGYSEYLRKLANGEAKVNSSALFPVNIVHSILNRSNNTYNSLYNAMWESLPNYLEGKEETGICVVDTSGSMHGEPYEVAVSLGVYCADKCRGPFHGKFITFSERPTLERLQGTDIVSKVQGLRCINAGNTDFEAIFDLILTTAKANNTPDSDLPKKLYVISDMQFDQARGDYSSRAWYWGSSVRAPRPFMETMKKKYEAAGYTMPMIVYWNVRESKCGMFQETFEGENCAIVSGYSPSIFKAVIDGTEYETTTDENGNETVHAKLDPMVVMLNTLNSPRYDRVVDVYAMLR